MTIELQGLHQSKKSSLCRVFRLLLSRLLLVVSSSAMLLLSSVLVGTAISPQAFAADLPNPAATAIATEEPSASTASILFEQNCAGCHVNGGNIIRRGKTLKKRAMTRNGYGKVEAIATIITHGKGIMSGYSDRLSEEEIRAIAQYVHNQSESGW